MAREKVLIGLCDCSECGSEQRLMKNGGGNLYLNCTECHTIFSISGEKSTGAYFTKGKKSE